MAAKSSDVPRACSSTLGEFKLNDNTLTQLQVFAEQREDEQKLEWFSLNVSAAHNDTASTWCIDSLMHDAEDRALCFLCCSIHTEPLKWKMWFVCNKALQKK